MLSRDMVEIKASAGGQAGTLSVGPDKVSALKLGPNVYVTSDVVPKNLRAVLNLDGADLHRIQNRADLVQFVQRWRVFSRG